MRPGKIRRLRHIIAGHSYLRDRAIQMGEQSGAWHAEWALSGFDRVGGYAQDRDVFRANGMVCREGAEKGIYILVGR